MPDSTPISRRKFNEVKDRLYGAALTTFWFQAIRNDPASDPSAEAQRICDALGKTLDDYVDQLEAEPRQLLEALEKIAAIDTLDAKEASQIAFRTAQAVLKAHNKQWKNRDRGRCTTTGRVMDTRVDCRPEEVEIASLRADLEWAESHLPPRCVTVRTCTECAKPTSKVKPSLRCKCPEKGE